MQIISKQKNLPLVEWACLAAVICFFAWLRFNLVEVPLERDEGEYAYGGQLLLQGILPYQLLYNMKLPGIYAAYAVVIKFFGPSHVGVHQGLIVVNGLAIFLIYILGRQILGATAGLAAAAAYGVLSIGQPVQGLFANAEHFVIVLSLAGVICLVQALDKNKMWLFILSGVLLGAGFSIKQHGVFFLAWAMLYLILHFYSGSTRPRKDMLVKGAAFSLGVILPYAFICLVFVKAGLFDKFWFWTVDYAKAYTSQVPLEAAWKTLKWRGTEIFKASPLVWVGVGLGALSCLKYFTLKRGVFVLSFAFFSFLAIFPGLFFRPHYFILLLPASALLFGVFVAAVTRFFNRQEKRLLEFGLSLVMIGLCVGAALYIQRLVLFTLTPAEITTRTYWPNPFNESLTMAEYIKKNSSKDDRIAIIGSEPQIYFYSGLKSATGYIYMYPLMEKHDFALKMQQELIKEVEAAEPEYLLFVRNPLSWLQKPGSHMLIYSWFARYKEGYSRVGMVEILEKSSRYSWTPNVAWPPVSPYWIEILRKK